MTPLLSDLVSSIFYDGKFNNMRRPENCAPVFSHPVLKDMTLCWVDVPHCRKMPKAREDRGGQRYNTLELEIVRELLQKMKFIGTGEPEIAILTPYNAQVDRLSGRYGLPAVLPEKLSGIPAFNPREHVFTVDSFQGHEADLVILSLVRNNPLGSPRNAWGFIISPERLNVMFSRMRRHLVVVGCASHVRAHSDHEDMKHFASVLNYIEAKGVIMDYQNLGVRF
jgi:superfamily I DNA and/or RNA helicase